MSNLLHQKKYLKAIGLAITLEQPFRVLNIIKGRIQVMKLWYILLQFFDWFSIVSPLFTLKGYMYLRKKLFFTPIDYSLLQKFCTTRAGAWSWRKLFRSWEWTRWVSLKPVHQWRNVLTEWYIFLWNGCQWLVWLFWCIWFSDSVLRFASEWNTNSRHCHEAQFVLNSVLKTHPPEEILKFPNIKSTMEAFIPYTGFRNSIERPVRF